MVREINRRDVRANRISRVREGERPSRAEAAAAGEERNYIQRALEYVQRAPDALGLAGGQSPEFLADPQIQRTSSGAVTVHLHQQYKGIPIFEAQETVRFAPDGNLTETAGSTVSVQREVPVAPRISVEDAVRRAAEHAAEPGDEPAATDKFGQRLEAPAVDLAQFSPRVTATFPSRPDRPTVLEPGPFGDEFKANLVWFPTGGDLRLAWEVVVTMPDYAGQYRIMVDAESGDILYARQLMKTVTARANVYRVDPEGGRQSLRLPSPLSEYGLPTPPGLPQGFPEDWVTADSTLGNSVAARLGNAGPPLQGTMRNGVMTFNPSDASGDDQKVLNIFYYCSLMHDYFYLLGFRESDGNFQFDNFGRGGVAGDRVDARAFSGPVWGTASMATPVDGASPVMRMGLVSTTGRHTAFDATVVFHEYTHGVTNRLVGGPMNDHALEEAQSAGMGEGWSDYIACIVTGRSVVGSWVLNTPTGFRDFEYDSNFPDDFGDLGAGRYDGSDEHAIGEIWCAALMELTRRVGDTPLTVQLVVDALKVSPANPSFLDMRDAIFAALDAKLAAGHLTTTAHATARSRMWAVFAEYGMGPAASSDGPRLTGIVPDFAVPGDEPGTGLHAEATPRARIPDNRASGVTSELTIAGAGVIERVTVSLTITHSYVGDLRVTLTSPAGTEVLLHNKSGGASRNLNATYSSDGSAPLARLIGEPAAGVWRLKAADVAAEDEGVLEAWQLDIVPDSETRTARAEAAPGLIIPDEDPAGVLSTVTIAASGTATGIEVAVDITHPYVGDLRLELMAPDGQAVLLQDNEGGSGDDLVRTYTSSANNGLTTLVGRAVQGSWTLRVADLAAQDVGQLNAWSIVLKF